MKWVKMLVVCIICISLAGIIGVFIERVTH